MTDNYNPYQAPESEWVDEQNEEFGLLEEPNSLSAGSGMSWITESWQIFMARPLLWVGVFVAYFAAIMLLGLIPIAGSIIVGIIAPMLMGGMAYMAYLIEHDESSASFGDMFVAFQGKFVDFLILWVIQFLLSLLIIIIMIIIGVAVMGFGTEALMAGDIDTMTGLLMILIMLALLIPLAMMAIFSPILIIFHDLSAWSAMKLSLKACFVNMLPFLIYGIVATVAIIIGAIPFGLGLLVVSPVLIISTYIAYKQILTSQY